ncbi:transcription factor HES-5-like [Engraulis encrasicolus]|uniref:transcription factor HES-5-like n=1 Tax=Engraulis encrasicolus TaxID=184585 RepID=UPI002FCFBBF7
MAPTVTVPMTYSMEHLPLNIKVRKPLVEKLRRDRINNSIEHLKTLLGQEFLKQHPDSKQEKADILEMTVHFLRQKQQQQNASTCSTAANEGYSRCMQEAVNFLSQCHVQTQSQRRLLSHFLHKMPAADKSTRVQSQPSSPGRHISSKDKTPGCAALWRPW